MKLHIESRGIGTPVVLLNGCPVSAEHMRPLAERLAESRRSLLVHLPNYDASPTLSPYDLERSHELVEEALLSLGVHEASFIGYSLGCYRAFAIASRGRVHARTIVGLGGFARYEPEERTYLRALAEQLRPGFDLAAFLVEAMLTPPSRERPECVEDVRKWATATSIEALSEEALALAESPDLLPKVAELDVPILLRVGLADAASPPIRSRRVAAIARRCVLEEPPGVGHAILCEDFEATFASIQRHLASVDAPEE